MSAWEVIDPDLGRYLIQVAREAIDRYLQTGQRREPRFPTPACRTPAGVFVTLTRGDQLRGCVGFPWPTYPLEVATIEAAIRATRDPRFLPLTEAEWPTVSVEVSVLTPPEPVDLHRVWEEIRVGRDGLIVRRGELQGLLLPQVATRFGWDVETFLAHTCRKAGLPPDGWRWEDVEVFKFRAHVFHERSGEEKI